MQLRFLRRTKHWTTGKIIGSKEFVQKIACMSRDKTKVMKKQFAHGKTIDGTSLYSYSILRKLD